MSSASHEADRIRMPDMEVKDKYWLVSANHDTEGTRILYLTKKQKYYISFQENFLGCLTQGKNGFVPPGIICRLTYNRDYNTSVLIQVGCIFNILYHDKSVSTLNLPEKP